MAKAWYPVIDYLQCAECGSCITQCSHGVYDAAKAPVPIVKNPANCIDHCHGCGNICPSGAITYVGEDTGWAPPAAKDGAAAEPCGCETGSQNSGCGCGCETASDSCGCGCETDSDKCDCDTDAYGCGCGCETGSQNSGCSCGCETASDSCGCGCDSASDECGCGCGCETDAGDCNCGTAAQKQAVIEYLYLDLHTCERCMGTEQVLDSVMQVIAPALELAGFAVTYRKIEVANEQTAAQYRFLASPTIRVNGADIGGALQENDCGCCSDISGTDVTCRTFAYDGQTYDVPPKEMLAGAILTAIFAPASDSCTGGAYTLPENLAAFYRGKQQKACACKGGCC